jgi:hypothetical protein
VATRSWIPRIRRERRPELFGDKRRLLGVVEPISKQHERLTHLSRSRSYQTVELKLVGCSRYVLTSRIGRTVAWSVDKRSLEEICHHRDIWTRLICTDTDCCPDGGRAILDNGRGHTVVQRARRLSELGRIETPVWRWQNLAEAADRGLELASRINRLAQTSSSITRVDTRALFAVSSVSHLRRLDTRARGVA